MPAFAANTRHIRILSILTKRAAIIRILHLLANTAFVGAFIIISHKLFSLARLNLVAEQQIYFKTLVEI
jgi:hypothetical protein